MKDFLRRYPSLQMSGSSHEYQERIAEDLDFSERLLDPRVLLANLGGMLL
jgi:hypothetical protein